jgi:hypothetical protein
VAFIPSRDIPKNNIGTTVILKRDLKAIKGIVTKGSLVVITGVGSRGYDIRDVESGEEMIECGFDIF